MINRRTFLANTSIAVMGSGLASRALASNRIADPFSGTVTARVPAHVSAPPDTFLAAMSPVNMHALAARAMDAAHAAGATYADIRLAEVHRFWPDGTVCELDTQFTFGVRVLMNGVWGFAFGRGPSTEAVVRCAQDAASSARMSSHLASEAVDGRGRPLDTERWVPAPVHSGEWSTPIAVDPFTVPIREHVEILDALGWVANRTGTTSGYIRAVWTKELRVFAATTGTHLTQQLHRAWIGTPIYAEYGSSLVIVNIPGLQNASAGYEILTVPDLPDRIKATCEAMVWLSRFPIRPLDIGKYPIVLGGRAMGDVLNHVLGPSAALDRVLGHHLDISESSRWSMDLLGTAIASPLLTLRGQRMLPSPSAVQWDDEGNVPVEHTILKNGVLVDYHTSGTTVGALEAWYTRRGQPLRSNGCANTDKANQTVSVQPPDLTLAPSGITMSVEDLCREMQHGVLALDDRYTQVHTDQQLSSGTLDAGRNLFEVSRGKIVRQLKRTALQFNTMSLLKEAVAVGDANTVQSTDTRVSQDFPWETTWRRATAPAVLFKEINAVEA